MKIFFPLLLLLSAAPAEAKMKVVTSVTDLKSLVQMVGKDLVEVQSIAKGTQDPHFLDAKPSYMTRLTNADLLVSLGLGLEDAWLMSVIKGARNPSLNPGAKGFLAVGPQLNPEEIPTGTKLSRSEGDVHPEGNPHVNTDPIRMAKAAQLIGDKLSELDPSHAKDYQANAAATKALLEKKTAEWQARIKKTGITKVVTYHRTLDYFLERMNLELAEVLEPKPGIAPSVSHLNDVVSAMKQKNANIVLIENYFDPTVANKLKELNPAVKVAVVPVSVEGEPKIRDQIDLFENLVSTLEKLK